MHREFGNIFVAVVWGIEVGACGLGSVFIARDLLRSVRSGVLYLNNRPIRRLSKPIVYWPLLVAGVAFWACIVRALAGLLGIV